YNNVNGNPELDYYWEGDSRDGRPRDRDGRMFDRRDRDRERERDRGGGGGEDGAIERAARARNNTAEDLDLGGGSAGDRGGGGVGGGGEGELVIPDDDVDQQQQQQPGFYQSFRHRGLVASRRLSFEKQQQQRFINKNDGGVGGGNVDFYNDGDGDDYSS